MRFRLTAIAALALSAPLAHAQSVTLFGVMDLSLRRASVGNTHVTQMATDGLANSRLGFRAEEDLGGGMKAGAWLEAAINPDSGSINASGKFWHRRSTASLFGPWGELRVGRDLNPSFWNLSIFDAFGTCGVGSGFNLATNLGSGAATLLRTDNAVAYLLPAGLGGFYGHFMVAPGEGVPGNKYRGGRLGYQSGGLNVAMAHATTDTATADDFKLTNAGISYDFKVVKLFALANVARYGAKKQTNWQLGASAPVGAAGLLRVSYQRADASGAGTDANDARQIAVGYVHNLSVRTALYATASHVRNSGAAAFTVGAPPAGAAGATAKGYEVGIRHAF
jgi:predicted porin